ncbi:MAG: glycosyltransferase family 39 protein [Bdellovibrionota bacterium]
MNFTYFWIITLLVKLAISSLFPLSGDEAYYWVWAQKLQLSYFDHPPMTGWLFALIPDSIKLLSRWPAVILGHLTFLIWYRIISRNSAIDWKKWQGLALLSPLLGLGSIIVTPDLPLLFFWSLSVDYFLRALNEKDMKYYVLLGLSLGLGFLSKYPIVLLVPIFLIFLGIEKKWNQVKWKSLVYTFVFGLVCCLPVFIWNYKNDWISFSFQWEHGFNQGDWNWRWTADFVLGTILLFFPTLFWGFFKSFKLKGDDLTFHKIAALVPLAFFTYSSFKGPSELNWALIAYPHMLYLFFRTNFKPWQLFAPVGFWVCLYSVVLFGIFFPQGLIHDKLREPFKYRAYSSLPTTYSPLFTSTYQMASSLWFISGTPVYKVRGVSRFDHFDLMTENQIPDRFFYMKEDYQEWPEALPESQWEKEEVSKPIPGHAVFVVRKK